MDNGTPPRPRFSREKVVMTVTLTGLVVALLMVALPSVGISWNSSDQRSSVYHEFSDSHQEVAAVASMPAMPPMPPMPPMPAMPPMPPMPPMPAMPPMPPMPPMPAMPAAPVVSVGVGQSQAVRARTDVRWTRGTVSVSNLTSGTVPVASLTSNGSVVLASNGTVQYQLDGTALAPAVANSPDLSEKSWIRLLGTVRHIPSASEQSTILKEASSRLPASDAVHAAYIDAASSITSGSEMWEALSAFVIRNRLSDETFVRLIRGSGNINSQDNRTHLLMDILERMTVSDDLVDAFENAVSKIHNESNKRRLTRALYRRVN